MAYSWTPTPYSFAELADIRKGDTGTKVAALQLNLGIPVDGDFGRQTDNAVRSWQAAHGLPDDGVAGYRTQRSIAVARSDPARVIHRLPPGFLKGKLEQESSFYLAAYSPHPSDWGYDLGAYQNSIGPSGDPADQSHFEKSYDVAAMAQEAAAASRSAHDSLKDGTWVQRESWYGAAMIVGDRYRPSVYAWQLAALTWNWPSAAQNLASVGSVYQDARRDDQPENWIIAASGGTLHTPREWVCHYMSNATKYCSF